MGEDEKMSTAAPHGGSPALRAQERLRIDDDVLAALGLTRDELSGMTLFKLASLCFDRGYEIECVECKPSSDPHARVTLNKPRGSSASEGASPEAVKKDSSNV